MQHFGGAPLVVWGDASNLVEPVHPAFNLRAGRAEAAFAHFGAMACDHGALMREGTKDMS